MTGQEPDLSPGEVREVTQRLADVQLAEGLTDEQIAGIIGATRSLVSQVRRGTYRGDAQKYLKRIRGWLERRQELAPIESGGYVETSIARLVLGVCTRAARRMTIGLVVTPSGVGKTEALREYARRAGDACVLLVGGESCATRSSLLWELADRLGVAAPVNATTAVVYRALKRRLAARYGAGKGQPTMILVDESTRISPAAINVLRSLHDEPATRTPVVLADTWRLDAELHSRRLPGGYEQLRSRAGAQVRWAVSRPIPAEDVRLVAESVVGSLGGRGRLPAATCRYLAERVANRPGPDGGLELRGGGLRNVMQRLHAVADLAEAMGAEPAWTPRELDYAAELVGMSPEDPDAANPYTSELPGGAGQRRSLAARAGA